VQCNPFSCSCQSVVRLGKSNFAGIGDFFK
jgi:hypothetical protein